MRTILVLAWFAAAWAYAGRANAQGTKWEIERGVEVPSYAVAEPTATDLNVGTVVLSCEQVDNGRVLQLQLYLSDDGQLRPIGVSPRGLADDPRASISIDGKQFPVTLLFADDRVLLADSPRGTFPRLSDRLIEALQTGRTMILQFELFAPRRGRHAGFDSKAIVDLETAGAREATSAMKRCVGTGSAAIELSDRDRCVAAKCSDFNVQDTIGSARPCSCLR
jgi:hypothetical protein